MSEGKHDIRSVRIDVPLKTSAAYLFVDAEQSKWDPWWAGLFEHLLRLLPAIVEWRYEPVQDVFVARPELTDQQRSALVRFLRTAPARQIEEHRTLRRAVELGGGEERGIEVTYFSGHAGGRESRPRPE